ncbi:MAG: 16S rRNA (cytosine(967)-C(5))-methyltransferase RsmB [Candidatus Obscuribacterales bacterium]|nr:16S rRNA (cytosine(967)-C(5))-methyltransferase RsmB [Candidatus Obscuribacterales bacterium]
MDKTKKKRRFSKEDLKKKKGLKARKIAVETLTKVDLSGAYANIALDKALEKSDMEERDRAFTTALVLGVLRNRQSIDATLQKLSTKPIDQIKAPVLNLLRVAVFQLNEMPDIPQSAVLDTACDIARLVAHEGVVKFVAGILRSHQRSIDGGSVQSDEQTNLSLDQAEKLAIDNSLPEFIVRSWLKNYGEQALEIIKHCQKAPRLTLRVSSLAIETAAYKEILEKAGIESNFGELVPECLVLKKGARPDKLPGFAEGLFAVQDEAAAFVSKVVDPKAGETIVDLCAAPGGKTLHMAELMEGKGRVVAVDISESRLNLLKESRLRMDLRNIESKSADGKRFKPGFTVDRVLVDAPCSGTGVIAKRSDLRFNRQEEDIKTLSYIQKALLENAAEMLRPGGVLVYSTCSIEPEEGPDIVESFLAKHSDFERTDIGSFFPEGLLEKWNLNEAAAQGSVMFLPPANGSAGFYIARMLKKS